MLRAFGVRTMMEDRELWARRARRAGMWALMAGAVALLCGAARGTMGFAMALVAAALLSGWNVGALAAGCAMGTLWEGLTPRGVMPLCGAATVLAGCLGSMGLDALREKRGGIARRQSARQAGPRVQARSPTLRAQRRAAILAGMATLLPGLILADGDVAQSLGALASAVAAVCAAPFLLAALRVRPGRRFLTGEERAGLLLLAGMLACGAAALWLPLGAALAGTLAVLLWPAGATAGGLLGLMMLLPGADARYGLLIAAAGMLAQLCGDWGATARGGAACGGILILSVLLCLPPPALLIAVPALLSALLPCRWRSALAAWAAPPREACDPDQVARLVRRESARRLEALSAAFDALAEGYPAPEASRDEQRLIPRMREKLCEGCSRAGTCWDGEGSGGARFLCALLARAAAWSAGEMAEPLFEAEATPDLLRRCRRGELVGERLGEILEDYARQRRAEQRRGAENRVISAQFRQARALLDGAAESLAQPTRLRSRVAERAGAALEAEGVPVGSVLTLSGRNAALCVTLREGCWDRPMAEAAAASLQRALGRAYRPEGPWGRELRFARRPRLRAEVGEAETARQADAPSGDSHAILELDGQRLLALLCDGMGSGDAAARESTAAVRLLARFMAAGASSALAVDTANALLLNGSPEDMFATVDMLVLELDSGSASFTKLAACPTLIGGAAGLRRVQGGRLPLGILERVQPARTRLKLAPGDTLAMLSDGVWEALGTEGVAELLSAGETDMSALAARILDAAQAVTPEDIRDDMTAICVRLREEGAVA